MPPGWGIKVSHASIPIAWDVLWPNIQFPGCYFSLNMASCHFCCFFNTKIVIFGHTRTWNATWIIYSHCLRSVLAHYPVSRLNISSNMAPMAPCHFGWFFTPQKHPFLDPPGPGMKPGWGIKVSKTPFPIAWDVLWPIIMFPGWFFLSIWHPFILADFFYPQNTLFWTVLDLEWHLDLA